MLIRTAPQSRSSIAAHFFHCLGVQTQAELRHFLRLHSFHLQVESEPPHRITVLRLKHVSEYGDLETTAEGLARICESGRESLREITLNNCGNWSERLTGAIANCSGVEVLNLAYSRLEDADLDTFSRALGRLKRLILKETKCLTAKSSLTLGQIASLRELDITGVNALPLAPLSALPLSCLLAGSRNLSAADLQSLQQMTTLQVISLRKCTGLSSLAKNRISALPRLTSLLL